MATAKVEPIGLAKKFLACVFLVCSCPFLLAGVPALPSGASPAWTAKDLAVIVNDSDPLSISIAKYYQAKRHIPANQVIHVRFKTGIKTMSETDFKTIKQLVDQQTPAHVQGYALTWLLPYRVGCMSITTAFAVGFDRAFCAKGCNKTRHSPYFNSISARPYDDFHWRPTIILADDGFTATKALIDRGVAADHTLPTGSAYLLKTSDAARSTRALSFPDTALKFNKKFTVNYLLQDDIKNRHDVMFYFTGLKRVKNITTNHFLPGAIADHLTSAGGILRNSYQMSLLEWIRAGATGSYGTVVEPCNFPEKFPNPAVLMGHYLAGSTLIEAYWKSVAEPGQGLFVGEPLAKPFAKPN
jgi:uncharacterized protein (TIGR03790 family)